MSDSIKENIFYALKYRSSSYKCFLLLYLLKRINDKKRVFSFEELSKGIVIEAWGFLPSFDGPLTKIDDLFDLCLDLIESSNYTLTTFSSEKTVSVFLDKLEDKGLKKRIRNLCLIAPYRLNTNESTSEFLHGVIDRKKSKIIEELSHHYDLFYVIEGKVITINPDYVNYIIKNRDPLIAQTRDFVENRYVNN